jgi:integrase
MDCSRLQFPKLKWARQVQADKPDPFTESERDRILRWYWRHERFWYPWVFVNFWTGARDGELAALRLSDIDLERAWCSIKKSRSEKHEGPPKTPGSEREITLLPNVVEALRQMPARIGATDDTYLFATPERKPVTDSWWPKRSWYRALTALKIRPRKFYATRHTFISVALGEGCLPQDVADYTGTSTRMIEDHYAKWIKRESLGPLRRAMEPAPGAGKIDTSV